MRADPHRGPSARIPTVDLWILLALTIGGTALRFYLIGAKSLWYDEAVIYHLVQGSWHEILSLNPTVNSAPPLYPLLLALVTGPGASEADLRTTSALAGILSIPLGYVLAREFLTSRAALLVPLLVACAPTQVYYAQQLREYSLTAVLAMLMLITCSKFIRAPDPRHALSLGITAAVALATQYGLALLLAGLNLVCLVALRRAPDQRRAYGLWFCAQVPAATVAAILVVTVMQPQFGVVSLGRTGYLSPYYWDGTFSGLVTLLTGPENNLVWFAFPGILMLLLTAAGTLSFLRRPVSGLAIAFLVVPTALTVACAMIGLYPYGPIRQDVFLTPMLYVTAALGLQALGTVVLSLRPPALVVTGAAAVLVAALTLPGLFASIGNLRWEGREPLRPVVAGLAERVRPGDLIYVHWGAVPAFRYYWRQRQEPWIQGAAHYSGLDDTLAPRQLLDVESELLALVKRGQPFWLVVTAIWEPDRQEILTLLRRYATVGVEREKPGAWLLRVTPLESGTAPASPVGANRSPRHRGSQTGPGATPAGVPRSA